MTRVRCRCHMNNNYYNLPSNTRNACQAPRQNACFSLSTALYGIIHSTLFRVLPSTKGSSFSTGPVVIFERYPE